VGDPATLKSFPFMLGNFKIKVSDVGWVKHTLQKWQTTSSRLVVLKVEFQAWPLTITRVFVLNMFSAFCSPMLLSFFF